jgi:hypothetical protein
LVHVLFTFYIQDVLKFKIKFGSLRVKDISEISRPKLDGAIRNLRQLYNEGLHCIHSAPNDFCVTKLRMRWIVHLACVGERTGACMFMVGKPEGNVLFIRSRSRCKNNSRENLKKIFGMAWTGLIWLWVGRSGGLLLR